MISKNNSRWGGRPSWPNNSVTCWTFVWWKDWNPPSATITTKYLNPVVVITSVIENVPILNYDDCASGSFPCLFSSRVSKVVKFPKTNSRWNLKKSMIVTIIMMLSMIAPVITITEKIFPKFPVLNWDIRVDIQMTKMRALMKVRRIV